MESNITTEQAKAALEAARQARVKQCNDEIQAALQKHHCQLEALFTVSTRGVQPQIVIVPLE